MARCQYYLTHGFPVIRTRAFNHLGPGQKEDFVAAAFAMRVARIEMDMQDNVMQVGDLSEKRDFTDVRDIVRAYHLIMQKGKPGEVYNVCSGQARSVQSLLDIMLDNSKVPIIIEQSRDLMRRDKIPVLQGDNSRLYLATGWQPEIPFEQTVLDILNDARQRVAEEVATSG